VADDKRVLELKAELRELRADIERLEAELRLVRDVRRADRGTSMRVYLRCPHCGCRKILHARRIADRTESGSRELAVALVGFWVPKPVGRFECHICTDCGFVEWHVEKPSEVGDATADVELIDADDPSAGPYR
jgi:hypothetical protein